MAVTAWNSLTVRGGNLPRGSLMWETDFIWAPVLPVPVGPLGSTHFMQDSSVAPGKEWSVSPALTLGQASAMRSW